MAFTRQLVVQQLRHSEISLAQRTPSDILFDMHAPTVFTVLVAATALVNNADAHGYISSPRPDFVPGQMYTNYNAEFTAAEAGKGFTGKIFNRSPEQNMNEFTKGFKESGLPDLKTLMDKFVPGCGNTNPDTTPRDVANLKTMDWQNNEYKEGFLGSHRGPCEVWIGETRVFQDNDCAGNYKSYPAKLPVDYSKCSGTCRLTFYWLALHSQKWQAYKQCVPIKNGSGGAAAGGGNGGGAGGNTGGNGGGNGGGAASPAVTPAPVTTKPEVVAPEAAAPAPAPAPAPASNPKPAAPAPSSKNCKRRQRRALTQEA